MPDETVTITKSSEEYLSKLSTKPTLSYQQTLERALMLACERIADGPQEYHEADTPVGWFEKYVRQAQGDLKGTKP